MVSALFHNPHLVPHYRHNAMQLVHRYPYLRVVTLYVAGCNLKRYPIVTLGKVLVLPLLLFSAHLTIAAHFALIIRDYVYVPRHWHVILLPFIFIYLIKTNVNQISEAKRCRSNIVHFCLLFCPKRRVKSIVYCNHGHIIL